MLTRTLVTTALLLLVHPLSSTFAIPLWQLMDEDNGNKPANMSQPVQVFVLMGQSNMLEFGQVQGIPKWHTLEHAVKTKGRYSFLLDEAGDWTVRQDVRNVAVMGSGGPKADSKIRKNDWLTVAGSKRIGVEIGIGYYMGGLHKDPVLILKSAIGGRSLGWDLLPPGSQAYNFTDPRNKQTYVYAGHGQGPIRWKIGTKPVPGAWTAGVQYDGDVARAKQVLSKLNQYYPNATKYEIAGFFWWQGDKDLRDVGHSKKYERNLVNLIKALRKDFNAPNAMFVCATLGQTHNETAVGTAKDIIDAQLAVSDSMKYPEFQGNVATVYTHPLSKGGSSSSHYNNNAKTYIAVGKAMGRAMVALTLMQREKDEHQ